MLFENGEWLLFVVDLPTSLPACLESQPNRGAAAAAAAGSEGNQQGKVRQRDFWLPYSLFVVSRVPRPVHAIVI